MEMADSARAEIDTIKQELASIGGSLPEGTFEGVEL
jgi:hypothetical protein